MKTALLLVLASLLSLGSAQADAEILSPEEWNTAKNLHRIEMAPEAPTSTTIVEQNLRSDKEILRIAALRVVAIHRLAALYASSSEWLSQQLGATGDLTRVLVPVFASPKSQEQPLIFAISPQELDIFALTSEKPIILPLDSEHIEHILPTLFSRDLQNEKWDPAIRQQGEAKIQSFQKYRYIGPGFSFFP